MVAATASTGKSKPTFELARAMEDVCTKAARPAIRPANVWAMITVLSTGTPEKRAAVGLSPTDATLRPKTVRERNKAIANANKNQNGMNYSKRIMLKLLLQINDTPYKKIGSRTMPKKYVLMLLHL